MARKLTLMMGTLLLAGMAATGAQAENHDGKGKHHGPGGHFFKKMDTNHDGAVSKEESLAFIEGLYTKADTDGDGTLTRDEMKAHHKAKMREKHCKD